MPGALGLAVTSDSACVWREPGYVPPQRLVCWGDNRNHHFLNDSTPTFASGTYNEAAFANPIDRVVMGPTWTMAQDSAGALVLIGDATRSEDARPLGLQHADFDPLGPSALTRPADLFCGETFCYAHDASSATMTFVWGDNASGSILSGANPVAPPAPFDFGDWREGAGGRAHACVARRGASTTVYCAGDNAFGQLGVGDTMSHFRSLVAAGTSGSFGIDAGGDTTCVINDAHQVACWGRNDFGQCGLAGPLPQTSPSMVPMPTGDTPRLIGVGATHACAVLASNRVVCWGQNAYGQLGNGTQTDSVAPVFVTGLP
jgi:hypothetical protein